MIEGLEQYLEQFGREHRSALRPHVEIGNSWGDSPGAWKNVGYHCLMGAVVCDIIAELIGLGATEHSALVWGAILHDWYKPHEVGAIRASLKDGTFSLETLNRVQREGDALLRDRFEVPLVVISLAGSPVAPSILGHDWLPHRIIYYADAILTELELVPLQQRFDNLERGWYGKEEDHQKAAQNRAFSDAFKPMYSGRSLYEVQRVLGAQVETELAMRIGFDRDPTELPQYLGNRVAERCRAVAQKGE